MKSYDQFILEHKLHGKSISEFLRYIESLTFKSWVWLDTETTGLKGPTQEQLTQVSAMSTKYYFESNEFKELDTYNEKIKLTDEIKTKMKEAGSRIKWVLSLNHYGQRNGKYFDERSVLNKFNEWLSKLKDPMLVIQNAEFDMNMINGRSGRMFNYDVLDTKQIIQLFYLPAVQALAEHDDSYKDLIAAIGTSNRDNGLISSSMSKVGPALGIDMAGYHDALTDCRIMMQMFQRIVEFLKRHEDLDIKGYQMERIFAIRKG